MRIVKILFFYVNLVELLHNLSIIIDKERGIELINFVLSLLLGAVPDTLYYYLYLTRIKDIKNRRLALFLLILAGYVLFFMIIRFNLYLYLAFYVYLYLVLKFIIKKADITDFFLLLFIDVYCMGISAILYFSISNYFLALIISKVLIFVPLIFKDKLKKMYQTYRKLWNKSNNKERKIKSITLRNISLIILNAIIVLTYLFILYTINNL